MVRLSAAVLLAAALGVALGAGLWMLAGTLPRFGAARLAARIAPQLTDVSEVARDIVERRPADPLLFLNRLAGPLAGQALRLLGAVSGGDGALEARLRRAGSALTASAFRGRQLLWGAAGAAFGCSLAILIAVASPGGGVASFAVVILGSLTGVLAPDRLLERATRRRRARIAEELPTVLELFTLALSAGEGVPDAVRRVARAGRGDLAAEFGVVAAEVGAGASLADALRRCAHSLDVPALTRAVDQLRGALERGTPVVDVLRAQAHDSHDDRKRLLLESAGRKEIAMLVPLVFLILPVTVAFAIFPGILVLQLGF